LELLEADGGGCWLPAIGCRLSASSFQLPAAGCWLPVPIRGSRLSDFGDSGMEDGDWELVI